MKAWEGRAYDYCMENLKAVGFPVDGLAFDPDLVIFFINVHTKLLMLN